MDFVLSELDKAAGLLTLKHAAANMGRITKGTPWQLKQELYYMLQAR